MPTHLEYTNESLLAAVHRALFAAGGRAHDFPDAVLTAASAVYSGLARVGSADAARIAKAAHDRLVHGALDCAADADAAEAEAAFVETRLKVAGAVGHDVQLLAGRLLDGFNTERGIRIFFRGVPMVATRSDGDIDVSIPFRYDDDAPEQGRATFVATIDPVTLAPLEACAVTRDGDRFGFVSSVVLDEVSTHVRGGLAVGYRMRLESGAADPRRGGVLSAEERATILCGWIADYMAVGDGVSNVQVSTARIVERGSHGALRMEASACFDMDDDRFGARLVVHVTADNPFYVDAVVVDEDDRAVAWLDMDGRTQAFEAAGMDFDTEWATNYENLRGESPLQEFEPRGVPSP